MVEQTIGNFATSLNTRHPTSMKARRVTTRLSPCLMFSIKGIVWRTSQQIRFLCPWASYLMGCLYLWVVSLKQVTAWLDYRKGPFVFPGWGILTNKRTNTKLHENLCMHFFEVILNWAKETHIICNAFWLSVMKSSTCESLQYRTDSSYSLC